MKIFQLRLGNNAFLVGLCIVLFATQTGMSSADSKGKNSQKVRLTPSRPRGIPILKRRMATHLKKSCLRKNQVGIRAFSLSSKEALYDLRGNELFIPASNIKIMTTAAAFHYLKPNFQFRTNVYHTGKVSSGILKGDMYLKGFGDPSLVSEELWLLVRKLRLRGLRKVNGNLFVDDTYFDTERFVPGTKAGHGHKPYQAPNGAASLNFNTLSLYVKPNQIIGKLTHATVDPKSNYIQLVNKSKTVGRRRKANLRIRRTSHANGDMITLEGRLPIRSKGRQFWVSITNPTLYLGHTFREFLFSEGITVTGNIRKGKTPKTANLLTKHKSKTLSIILRDLNKWSNNFIAEQVLKTLGAKIEGPPGTRAKGISVIGHYMNRLAYKTGTFIVDDGAGLSRKSRVSPAQLVRVLTNMYDDIRFRPEFVASLAVMGVDGSIRNRLDDTLAERRIRAKTGTLNGVDTLSGYAFSMDGDVIAFSILMNGSRCPHWQMRQLQDRITLELVRLDRRTIVRKRATHRRQ